MYVYGSKIRLMSLLPPIRFSLYHITAVTTGVVLAAVLATVVTATLVTPPVLTAVTTACHDGPS